MKTFLFFCLILGFLATGDDVFAQNQNKSWWENMTQKAGKMVDEHTTTTDELLEASERIQMYKDLFLEKGFSLQEKIDTDDYRGFVLLKDNVSFEMVLDKSLIGNARIFLRQFWLYKKDIGLSFVSDDGHEYDFFYFDSRKGDFTTHDPLQEGVLQKYLIVHINEFKDFKGAFDTPVRDILRIFNEECQKL